MEQELIKSVVKVGNSAGVILPKEWLNATAKIKLVRKPVDLKKEILELLGHHLEDICGIYIVGSYARVEQTQNSDIDVLVITNNTNTKLKKGKYNLIFISKEDLKVSLRNDIMPLLPMLIEAKAIVNEELITKYITTPITNTNLRPIIEITKSSIDVNYEFIRLAEKLEDNLGDGIAYSLVLNLRTLYLLECLKKNKKWSTSELRKLIIKISGSKEAYEGYIRCKNGKKDEHTLKLKEAEKLYEHLFEKLNGWDKWLKGKKD